MVVETKMTMNVTGSEYGPMSCPFLARTCTLYSTPCTTLMDTCGVWLAGTATVRGTWPDKKSVRRTSYCVTTPLGGWGGCHVTRASSPAIMAT